MNEGGIAGGGSKEFTDRFPILSTNRNVNIVNVLDLRICSIYLDLRQPTVASMEASMEASSKALRLLVMGL